jgi:hypothetical protein
VKKPTKEQHKALLKLQQKAKLKLPATTRKK